MLGSREEAEDAVQHTFAAAYRDLRERRAQIGLKAVALHDRAQPLPLDAAPAASRRSSPRPATARAREQVEQRAELRELLR